MCYTCADHMNSMKLSNFEKLNTCLLLQVLIYAQKTRQSHLSLVDNRKCAVPKTAMKEFHTFAMTSDVVYIVNRIQ